jgi:NADH:ubiquinone oxidoreductase subunit E
MQGKKHQVVICTGTLCHVLGGSELPALGTYIPKEWNKIVDIKGSSCLEHCKNTSMKPPFAEIDGTLIQEATIQKLIDHLKNCIENDSK